MKRKMSFVRKITRIQIYAIANLLNIFRRPARCKIFIQYYRYLENFKNNQNNGFGVRGRCAAAQDRIISRNFVRYEFNIVL